MQRMLLIAANIANTAMVIAAAVIFFSAYRLSDRMLALLLFVPPLLSIAVLCNRPDKEERELAQTVRKARLRKELKDLQEAK